jgi:hypothetical protein
MTGAMADSMAEAEGTAGTTGGTAVDGTVVVPDGWIGITAIDFIGSLITVIGGSTVGSSGKPSLEVDNQRRGTRGRKRDYSFFPVVLFPTQDRSSGKLPRFSPD